MEEDYKTQIRAIYHEVGKDPRNRLEVEARMTHPIKGSRFYDIIDRLGLDFSKAVESVDRIIELKTGGNARQSWYVDSLRSTSSELKFTRFETIQKIRKKTWDDKYGIRIAVSVESDYPVDEFFKQVSKPFIRRKWRIEHRLPSGFRLDLTKVIQGHEGTPLIGEPRYEVELELPQGSRFLECLDKLNVGLAFLLSQVTQTILPYTVTEKEDLFKFLNQGISGEVYQPKPGYDETLHSVRSNIVTQARTLLLKDLVEGNIVPYPVSISKETPGYYVGLKADGLRCFVILHERKTWLVVYPDVLILVDRGSVIQHPRRYQTLVLEGEYIPKIKPGFYVLVYDCLYYENYEKHAGFPIRLRPLEERFFYVEQFLQDWTGLNPLEDKKILITLLEKKVYPLMNKSLNSGPMSDVFSFYNTVNSVLDYEKVVNYDIDGLIFTPNSAYLPKNSDLLKWKPGSLSTVDLLYKEGKFYCFKAKPTKLDPYEEFDKSLNPKSFQNWFGGFTEGSIYEIGWINQSPTEADDNESSQGFPYVKGIRTNKDVPNGYWAAHDAWNMAKRPITEDTMRGNDLALLRQYHNREKRRLLLKGSGTLLDLGSGRGGDISKQKHYTRVIAVEPDKGHISEYQRRLIEYSTNTGLPTTRTLILNTGAEDTDTIFSQIGSPVDVVSMMLSLTFFFSTEDLLNQLIHTIDVCTHEGSMFLVAAMDGQRLKAMIQSGDYLLEIDPDTNTVSVDVKPHVLIVHQDIAKGEFSERVGITLAGTIVQNQIEWLTNFDILTEKLSAIGFNKTEDIIWDGQSLLNPTETLLTRLYRSCVYVRGTVVDTKDVLDPKFNPHVWGQIQNDYYKSERDPEFSRIFPLDSDYPRRPFEVRRDQMSLVSWRSRKLLLSDIEFLTKFGKRSQKIIYSIPGDISHIQRLVSMFPKHQFLVFNLSGQRPRGIKSFPEIIDEQKAKAYSGQNVLFISHLDYEKDRQVHYENTRRQLSSLNVMKPIASSITMMYPFQKDIDYPAGELYFPVWGSYLPSEAQMYIDSEIHKSTMEISNSGFMERLWYFLTTRRPSTYSHDFDVPQIDHCYDCKSETVILSEYLSLKNTSDEYIKANIKPLIEGISKDLGGSLNQLGDHDPSLAPVEPAVTPAKTVSGVPVVSSVPRQPVIPTVSSATQITKQPVVPTTQSRTTVVNLFNPEELTTRTADYTSNNLPPDPEPFQNRYMPTVLDRNITNILTVGTKELLLPSWLGRYGIIRQGVPQDGSCMIHALLTLLDPEFEDKSPNDKYLEVVDTRKAISELTELNFASLYRGINLKDFGLSKQQILSDLENPEKWLGEEHMKPLMSYFQADIYILYQLPDRSLAPYRLTEGTYSEKYPVSVILFWVGQNHYEPVYVVVETESRSTQFSTEPVVLDIRRLLGVE